MIQLILTIFWRECRLMTSQCYLDSSQGLSILLVCGTIWFWNSSDPLEDGQQPWQTGLYPLISQGQSSEQQRQGSEQDSEVEAGEASSAKSTPMDRGWVCSGLYVTCCLFNPNGVMTDGHCMLALVKKKSKSLILLAKLVGWMIASLPLGSSEPSCLTPSPHPSSYLVLVFVGRFWKHPQLMEVTGIHFQQACSQI